MRDYRFSNAIAVFRIGHEEKTFKCRNTFTDRKENMRSQLTPY
jgi:hypothetical protein